MLNTLFGKISLIVFGLFIAVSALLISTIDNSATALQKEAAQKIHLDLARNLVKEKPLWLESGVDAAAVEAAFHMMMVLGPTLELYIIAPDGRLVKYSDPEGKVVRTSVSMDPIHQFLNDSSILPIYGDDPRTPGTRKIFSAAPIYAEGVTADLQASSDPVGYLYIILGGLQYDSAINMLNTSHFARLGFTAIAIGTIFVALVMLMLFFVLTRPIRKLAAGIADFRNVNFLHVPATLPLGDPDSKDELNQLLLTVREMAARIVQQFNDMIASRNLRQQLITHISHDLRTPLASIRGYLESWQINLDQMNTGEAQHCVDVSLKNCDQLEHMVEELFELSRLEANEITPDFETFPLHELVDDIITTLRLKAAEKNIELLTHSPAKLPFVHADIGHINRVFTNLLDNAIRHSYANSQIVIAMTVAESGMAIDIIITDSGAGIPAAEIPLVFEPYFRASNQDQHYRQGTGLGLAITKRLLLLHGSHIKVESRESAGTVFSFSLPCNA